SMTAFVDLSRFAPNIAAMLGLGVGIDYALFIVARYRENLLAGHDPEDAVGIAMATAGKAVAFAAAVVITSLLGLGLMGIPFVGWLGVAAAAMVVTTMLTALTLLPAVLGLLGRRAVTARQRREAATSPGNPPHRESRWYRLGLAIMRRPYWFFALSTLVLLTLSIPVAEMRLGSADAGSNPADSTTRRAYDLVAEAFGPGMNGPLQVVVQGATPGELEQLRSAIAEAANVQAVGAPLVHEDGGTAVLSVVPGTSPQAEETDALVHLLRGEVVPEALAGGDAAAYVGGATARAIDIAERIRDRLPVFFGLVIGISFVLLVMVFRSLMIPVKAALM
ncbi:MAG: MMPL family transporter, partial [Dehalococcoidia bacterium]